MIDRRRFWVWLRAFSNRRVRAITGADVRCPWCKLWMIAEASNTVCAKLDSGNLRYECGNCHGISDFDVGSQVAILMSTHRELPVLYAEAIEPWPKDAEEDVRRARARAAQSESFDLLGTKEWSKRFGARDE